MPYFEILEDVFVMSKKVRDHDAEKDDHWTQNVEMKKVFSICNFEQIKTLVFMN